MKFVSLIAQFVASLSAGAQQENVLSVMKRIQRTYWKGEFRVEAFGGLVECAGPIDVWFFERRGSDAALPPPARNKPNAADLGARFLGGSE